MYMGGQALYAPTFKYERNPNCLVSGQGVDLEVSPAATLTHLVRRPPGIIQHSRPPPPTITSASPAHRTPRAGWPGRANGAPRLRSR